jgi:competence protein ComEA
MKHSIIKTALVALTLAMCASLSLAEEPQPQKAKQANAAAKAQAAAKKGKAAPPRVEPVDINSASKDELKKLPGVGDAEADKIIAGRPYLTKAHLVTHNIIPAGLYQALRDLVVARQKDAKFGKAAKK